ncbi:LptA/OstA family protein [Porphyrobacter sp. AAP82]|uniref:LptA/OstA family protein n=1 Tax=Porphyrobacter sp. AAP82 TaxID=1248917 RepID=UPI0002DE414E|nr:LptA/OstA family protein [Porphyrobacter sp. AAP82]
MHDTTTTPTRTPVARLALAWGIGGFALTAVLAGGMNLAAQGIARHDSRAPVTYDAGRFLLDDKANQAIATGGVTVTQAGLTVQSDRMLVNFTDAGGSLEIQRITATGGVVITRGNERASGDNAVYDFGRRIITMAGNVALRRGSDTLNGGRLVIDLDSGLSTVDGSAAGGAPVPGQPARSGRVTGTFAVPQGDRKN